MKCNICDLDHQEDCDCVNALLDEVTRLRDIIVDTNNLLFDGMIDDVEHIIESHPKSINTMLRKAATCIQAASNLMGKEILDSIEV